MFQRYRFTMSLIALSLLTGLTTLAYAENDKRPCQLRNAQQQRQKIMDTMSTQEKSKPANAPAPEPKKEVKMLRKP